MCACLCMHQPEERCRFAKLARHTGNFGERACGKGELAQGLLESRYVAGLCETARLVETKRFVTNPRIPRAVASARTARLPCCRPRDRFSTQRQPLSCALAGHAASADCRQATRHEDHPEAIRHASATWARATACFTVESASLSRAPGKTIRNGIAWREPPQVLEQRPFEPLSACEGFPADLPSCVSPPWHAGSALGYQAFQHLLEGLF